MIVTTSVWNYWFLIVIRLAFRTYTEAGVARRADNVTAALNSTCDNCTIPDDVLSSFCSILFCSTTVRHGMYIPWFIAIIQVQDKGCRVRVGYCIPWLHCILGLYHGITRCIWSFKSVGVSLFLLTFIANIQLSLLYIQSLFLIMLRPISVAYHCSCMGHSNSRCIYYYENRATLGVSRVWKLLPCFSLYLSRFSDS